MWADGREVYACHGVTSIENPLPVDPDTLFLLGSVTKTFTATAVMRLVADGKVELDAPVRRYVPELVLADERAAAEITVLNLLNHTAGLDWRVIVDTGEGDDALARYVAKLAGLELIAPPGARASYSQAGYNLAGRIIEKVTGLTFERAVASLVFEPLGLSHSFFAASDIMTRRFAVGHNRGEDGTLSIARQWKDARAATTPAAAPPPRSPTCCAGPGSTSATAARETARRCCRPRCCARCGSRRSHCGAAASATPSASAGSCATSTGSAPSGTADRPTASSPTCSSCRNGTSPSSRCATRARTASRFNQAVVRWALEHYLGMADRDPEPLPYRRGARRGDGRRLRERRHDVHHHARTAPGCGWRSGSSRRSARRRTRSCPPDSAPFEVGLLPGDEYIVTSGGCTGQRGFFTRDASGAVTGVDLAGRLATASSGTAGAGWAG